MIILPAIDIRGGNCVRLHQGDYAQETVYGADPVAMAQSFRDAGAEWLHVVDLDGAKAGRLVNGHVIAGLVAAGLRIEWGGGVRSLDTIAQLLDAGIERAILGSQIIKDPSFAEAAFSRFGSGVVAGLDVRGEDIAISGWQEQSGKSLFETGEWLMGLGCERFIVTDISTDGTLAGPNLGLAEAFMARFPGAKYIISGGVGSIEDVRAASHSAAEGLIVGKAIYDGRVSLAELFATISSGSL